MRRSRGSCRSADEPSSPSATRSAHARPRRVGAVFLRRPRPGSASDRVRRERPDRRQRPVGGRRRPALRRQGARRAHRRRGAGRRRKRTVDADIALDEQQRAAFGGLRLLSGRSAVARSGGDHRQREDCEDGHGGANHPVRGRDGRPATYKMPRADTMATPDVAEPLLGPASAPRSEGAVCPKTGWRRAISSAIAPRSTEALRQARVVPR